MQDELEDLRDCGIGACKPWFLSSLANIKVSFSYFKLNPDYIVRSSDCCLNIFLSSQRVVDLPEVPRFPSSFEKNCWVIEKIFGL